MNKDGSYSLLSRAERRLLGADSPCIKTAKLELALHGLVDQLATEGRQVNAIAESICITAWTLPVAIYQFNRHINTYMHMVGEVATWDISVCYETGDE